MGLGFVTDVASKAVGAGKSVASKASAVGGAAVDAGGAVVDAGETAVGAAKSVGGDVVEFSREVQEFKAEQEKNFANGVLTWGKDSASTFVDIASDPIGTAKSVGKLASNPVLNPAGGLLRSVATGKNPIEAYREGAGELKDIGSSLVSGYKDVYEEHGIAGLAGNLAPDIAVALATGGGGTAASVGAKTAGKVLAKDVAGEFTPGPEDFANEAREHYEPVEKPNLIQGLIENFG